MRDGSGVASRVQELGQERATDAISKEGDRYLRTLMVQGAHYILGPFGEDSVYGEGTAASRAWRKECQEASRRCGGPEVGCTSSPVVGKRRGL